MLPRTAEYALRAMAVLAQSPGVALRNTDLAERCQVPERYLSAVMRAQVQAGLVRSQRGRNGGYVLARSPAEIAVGDVILAAGHDLSGRPCAFGWDRCDAERPCPLHPLYSELNEAVGQWAVDRTLADVGRLSPPSGREPRESADDAARPPPRRPAGTPTAASSS